MKIVIDLPPEPKGRPRFTRSGLAYTPDKTFAYENAIKWLIMRKIKEPLKGMLRVKLDFYMPVPKSWSKRMQQAAIKHEIRPDVKPDIDNLVKAVLDAINGIAYVDDKQIVELICREYYSGSPRTEIEMEEL